MHQPEVARLARLLFALLFLLPLLGAGRSMLLAGAFVAEFLRDAPSGPLSALTETPERSTLHAPGAAIDRYAFRGESGRVPLVLVHGLAPLGKDEPRVGHAAELLARVGFDVAVPTIPGLTRLRLRPEDREAVVASVATRAAPTVVVGVSVGAGVALLDAADERIRDRISLVLSLGGYASARELVRYYLSGDFGHGATRGYREQNPVVVGMFVDANADMLDASARRVLAAGRADLTRELAGVSPELSQLLDALSPVRVLDQIRADLVLVHGRDDPAVPFTESLALRQGRPERTRLVLVGVVTHVEAAERVELIAGLRDVLALWSVTYGLVARA